MDDNDSELSTGDDGASSDDDTSSSPLILITEQPVVKGPLSRGATRSRGVTRGHESIRGHGATCSRGATSRTNPLGEWKKQETSGLCYNYSLMPGAKVQFRNNTSASNLFCFFYR